MYYKLMLAAIIISVAVCIAGCHTAKETDGVAFIIAMGIDKAEQGKIKVTYRIQIPRAVSGAQGAGQPITSGPALTNSIVAPNIAEARNLFSTSTSRNMNLTHMKAILISEEVARSGVADIIAPLIRYPEYRGTIFVCVVNGRADNFMENNHPKLDYTPSKFWESFMLSSFEGSYFLRAQLYDFYLRLKNPGGSPYATYVGLSPLTGEDKPAKEKLSNEKIDAYLAAEIPRAGTENPPELAGTAVFSGDKMVGTLDTRETRVIAMLQNNFRRGFFVLTDPLEPQKVININMRNGSKPKIDVDLIDGQEVVKINVFLEGEISSIPSGINYEKRAYRELLEEEISKLVTEEIQSFIRHTQELGSDVFGFGYYLRPHFTTYTELEKVNLEELYTTAKVDAQVTTKLRRTGLMWRSSPYKPTATSP